MNELLDVKKRILKEFKRGIPIWNNESQGQDVQKFTKSQAKWLTHFYLMKYKNRSDKQIVWDRLKLNWPGENK